MHLVEQRLIRSPGALGRLLRSSKPIRAFELKRTAGPSCQTPPRGIFPVRGMNNELPDVVPARRRSPRRLRRGDATNRAAEIRAVPGGMIVCLVEYRQEQANFGRLRHCSRFQSARTTIVSAIRSWTV